METRALGADGPRVSLVGLGCNNFGTKLSPEQSRAVIVASYEVGITHFDTAEMYGDGVSEQVLGQALGPMRDEVLIATKFSRRPPGEPYRPGLLRRRALDGCEGSLRRLGVDHIDVYYEHYSDPEAPLDEVLEVFGELIQAGKIRWAATSNAAAARVGEARALAARGRSAGFCALQTEWSLLFRDPEAGLVPAAREAGLGVVPYYPLASGMLTGKYAAGRPYPAGSRFVALPTWNGHATPENFTRVAALSAIAEEAGLSLLQLAMSWLAARPEVASVISGATTPEQVEQNAGSIVALSEDVLRRIDQAGD